jgi:hypothetical protein
MLLPVGMMRGSFPLDFIDLVPPSFLEVANSLYCSYDLAALRLDQEKDNMAGILFENGSKGERT